MGMKSVDLLNLIMVESIYRIIEYWHLAGEQHTETGYSHQALLLILVFRELTLYVNELDVLQAADGFSI